MSKIITKSNFEDQVIHSDKPILVDFFSKTCGPCRMLAPFIQELSEENTDFYVGKVCVDDEMELAMKYSITHVPTMLIFKNGECVDKIQGFRSKEELLEVMKGYVL